MLVSFNVSIDVGFTSACRRVLKTKNLPKFFLLFLWFALANALRCVVCTVRDNNKNFKVIKIDFLVEKSVHKILTRSKYQIKYYFEFEIHIFASHTTAKFAIRLHWRARASVCIWIWACKCNNNIAVWNEALNWAILMARKAGVKDVSSKSSTKWQLLKIYSYTYISIYVCKCM